MQFHFFSLVIFLTRRILSEEKDDDQIYELMNKDPTLCCKDKKAQKSRKIIKNKKRRRYSSSTDSDCSTPEPKRIPDHSAVLPKMVAQSTQQKSSKRTDELVCTPDILSMFSEPAEDTVSQPPKATPKTSTPTISMAQKSAISQPPPLIIRQLPTPSTVQTVQTVRFPNRQFSAVPHVTAAAPPPAYYTVNGFRVDLNQAAQQETYRLPNGKLIQVKKQTAANQTSGNNSANRNAANLQSRSNNANPNPYSIRFNIQQSIPPAPVQIQHNLPASAVHQGSAVQTLHQQHLQQQQQILNGISNVPMVPMAAGVQTPLATNRYPNTPVGQAQTELEKEIHGAQEICQQIVGKCNTLMKSNAYKSVRSFNDVKDLHLHLSYLFTYTIDKFTTLQSKCTDAMKSLTNAHEAANKLADKKNKYTNVDDDLEVVEPTTVCIELDSDDEIEQTANETISNISEKTKTKQPRKTSHQPKTNASVNDVEIEEPIEIIDNVDNDDLELPTPPALDSDSEDNESYDRENDKKLKSLPKVVLEKDEETERKLREILESENGATTPVQDESTAEINEPMDSIEDNVSKTNANESGDKDVEQENENERDKIQDEDQIEGDGKAEEDHKVENAGTVANPESINDIQDNEIVENDEKLENDAKSDECEKSEKGDIDDDLTNGRNNDQEAMDAVENMVDCALNNTNLSCPGSPGSPALTDNMENDLLDEMDHQNNLTDNSFENISSPDMFDDMSKNGFDKATGMCATFNNFTSNFNESMLF